MTTRLFLTAAILLGIAGGVSWVRGRGMPSQPAPLEMKAEELPLTLGDWKGEAVALDPEMFKHIGAQQAIDRLYRDRRGRAISLHMAVFEGIGAGQGPPHSPEECYPGNGWHLGDRKNVPLEVNQTHNVAELLPVERNGDSAYVLFWYQIDGEAFSGRDAQRKTILKSRGRPFLPPTIKVMLHMNSARSDDAQNVLQSFAGEVFAWTRNFH